VTLRRKLKQHRVTLRCWLRGGVLRGLQWAQQTRQEAVKWTDTHCVGNIPLMWVRSSRSVNLLWLLVEAVIQSAKVPLY